MLIMRKDKVQKHVITTPSQRLASSLILAITVLVPPPKRENMPTPLPRLSTLQIPHPSFPSVRAKHRAIRRLNNAAARPVATHRHPRLPIRLHANQQGLPNPRAAAFPNQPIIPRPPRRLLHQDPTALPAARKKVLHAHQIPRIRLNNRRQHITDHRNELEREVDGAPDEHGGDEERRQAAVDAARQPHERQGVQQRDNVADDGKEGPQGHGAELHVQAAAAVAVDPPLIAPGFGAEGLEHAGVVGGEAWGKGFAGLFTGAGGGDEDVVFGVL